jgi:hypothetical protein
MKDEIKKTLLFILHPSSFNYGVSITKLLSENENVGRLRPFIYLAAVCDSAVINIGSAIDGSAGT